MKTWRERIAEARARGFFSEEDNRAWSHADTCPVGEVTRMFSLEPYTQPWMVRWEAVNGKGSDEFSLRALRAMSGKDFAGMDDLMDQLDDRVLQLKREHTA